MAFKCSIGVVTYLGRFEKYFKPLIKKLFFLFPDYDINVFINGHYDIVKQGKYLRDVTTFLGQYPRIKHITNFQHQPLSRGWNWLVILAVFEHILILNDDITISPLFRYQLEKLNKPPEVFMINGSWSHFVISKEIIRRVGWFDERFKGVGYEDGDYMCRLAIHGIPIIDLKMHGIGNVIANQADAGWINFSGVSDGKYSNYNRELYLNKWYHSLFEEVPKQRATILKYKNERYKIALKEHPEEMPIPYPYAILNSLPTSDKNCLFPKILSTFDFMIYKFKSFIKKIFN